MLIAEGARIVGVQLGKACARSGEGRPCGDVIWRTAAHAQAPVLLCQSFVPYHVFSCPLPVALALVLLIRLPGTSRAGTGCFLQDHDGSMLELKMGELKDHGVRKIETPCFPRETPRRSKVEGGTLSCSALTIHLADDDDDDRGTLHSPSPLLSLGPLSSSPPARVPRLPSHF